MTDDQAIAALFAAQERAPDEVFVARMVRAVDAERRMAAARKILWTRFAVEAISSAAIVAALYLLWRVSPPLSLDAIPLAPTTAVIALLFLWFGIELNPPLAEGGQIS